MMDSLRNESAEWRFEGIEEAYKTTFDWIFENPELEFRAWLQKGSGVYWINGKPGSGKSTLMKHVYRHPQTIEIMAQRDQSRLQVTAAFFSMIAVSVDKIHSKVFFTASYTKFFHRLQMFRKQSCQHIRSEDHL